MQRRKIVYLSVNLFFISAALFAGGQKEIQEYVTVTQTLIDLKYYFEAKQILKVKAEEISAKAGIYIFQQQQQQINDFLVKYNGLIDQLDKALQEKNQRNIKEIENQLDEYFPWWKQKYNERNRNLFFQRQMDNIRSLLKPDTWPQAIDAYNKLLSELSTNNIFMPLISEYNSSRLITDNVKKQINEQLLTILEETKQNSIILSSLLEIDVFWHKFSTGSVNGELVKLISGFNDQISKIKLKQRDILQTGINWQEVIRSWNEEANGVLNSIYSFFNIIDDATQENKLENQIKEFHNYDLLVEYLTYFYQIIFGRRLTNHEPEGILAALELLDQEIQTTANSNGENFCNAALTNFEANNYEDALKNIILAKSAYNIAVMFSGDQEILLTYDTTIFQLEKKIKEELSDRANINLLEELKRDGDNSFKKAQDYLKKGKFEKAYSDLDQARKIYSQYLIQNDDPKITRQLQEDILKLKQKIDNAKEFFDTYQKAYNSALLNLKTKNYQEALDDVDKAFKALTGYMTLSSDAENLTAEQKALNDLEANIKILESEKKLAQENADRVFILIEGYMDSLNKANRYYKQKNFGDAQKNVKKANNDRDEMLKLISNPLVNESLIEIDPNLDIEQLKKEPQQMIDIQQNLQTESKALEEDALNLYTLANESYSARNCDDAVVEIEKAIIQFSQSITINRTPEKERQLNVFVELKEEILKNFCGEIPTPAPPAQYFYDRASSEYDKMNYSAARININDAIKEIKKFPVDPNIKPNLPTDIQELNGKIRNEEFFILLVETESCYHRGNYEQAIGKLEAFMATYSEIIDQLQKKKIDDLLEKIMEISLNQSKLNLDPSKPEEKKVLESVTAIDTKLKDLCKPENPDNVLTAQDIQTIQHDLDQVPEEFRLNREYQTVYYKFLQKQGADNKIFDKEYKKIMEEAGNALRKFKKNNGETQREALETAHLNVQNLWEYTRKMEVRDLLDKITAKLNPDFSNN